MSDNRETVRRTLTLHTATVDFLVLSVLKMDQASFIGLWDRHLND